MTCMNRLSRTSSPATIHAAERANLSQTARRRPSRRYARGQAQGKYAPSSQSVSPRTAAERKLDPPTAEGSPFRHQPTALCELWRRVVAHDVGSAPRSVLLLDALSPPPIHPLHPHRGKRAGGPGSCHPMNQRLPNEAFRNKRAAGGEGGSPEIRINLQVQATNRPGDCWVGLLARRDKRHREKTHRMPSNSQRPALQTQNPGPTAVRPRRFYSRLCRVG